MKPFLALALLCAAVSGCTSAGPFVTNISADGKGNLIIEKNMVNYNGMMGTVSAGEKPITETIRVWPEPQPPK